MTLLLKIFGIPGTIALASAIVLALLLGVCSFGLYTTRTELKLVSAELNLAKAERNGALQIASINEESSKGWEAIAETRKALLAEAQAENARVAADNQAALARARAETLDAERTLSQFAARFAASIRSPDCAAARARLDATCPLVKF